MTANDDKEGAKEKEAGGGGGRTWRRRKQNETEKLRRIRKNHGQSGYGKTRATEKKKEKNEHNVEREGSEQDIVKVRERREQGRRKITREKGTKVEEEGRTVDKKN